MADQPLINPNPSPKALFLAVKNYVETHQELVLRPELQRGFDFSLLQMQAELADGKADGNSAAANYFRLMGANDLIKTFKLLAVIPKPLPRPPSGDIDHNIH